MVLLVPEGVSNTPQPPSLRVHQPSPRLHLCQPKPVFVQPLERASRRPQIRSTRRHPIRDDPAVAVVLRLWWEAVAGQSIAVLLEGTPVDSACLRREDYMLFSIKLFKALCMHSLSTCQMLAPS